MSKEVEQLKQALELAKSKLQVAEKALNDIVKWDDIFRKCGMLDEHTEGYYIGCMNYIKEKYHPPKIK